MKTSTARRHRSRMVALVGLLVSASSLAAPSAYAEEGAAKAAKPTPSEQAIEGKLESREIDGIEEEAFPLNDLDPLRSVPTPEQAMSNPLRMGYFVMLLIERGKASLEAGNKPAAIKYYRALAKAVPERATAHGLLCKAYEADYQYEKALESCRTALGLPSVTVEDYGRFVSLMLRKPELTKTDIEDIDAVIAHIEKEVKEPETPALVANMRCEVGVRLEDAARLEVCTKELSKLAPKDARTVAFTWAYQMNKGDFKAAESTIALAKRLGLPKDAIEKMEDGMEAQRSRAAASSNGTIDWPVWVALALGLALIPTAAFMVSRRRRSVLAET